MQLLHCDNIQFDTVALLLLTLTHPKRITAMQLRSVSALSLLADTADTMYPMPESAVIAKSCYRKVGYSICTAFVVCGRWGYTLRIYALYIKFKNTRASSVR